MPCLAWMMEISFRSSTRTLLLPKLHKFLKEYSHVVSHKIFDIWLEYGSLYYCFFNNKNNMTNGLWKSRTSCALKYSFWLWPNVSTCNMQHVNYWLFTLLIRKVEKLERNSSGATSTINLCEKAGVKLLNHVISALMARSSLMCMSICSRRTDCKWINYHIMIDMTCELNNQTTTHYQAVNDLVTNLITR